MLIVNGNSKWLKPAINTTKQCMVLIQVFNENIRSTFMLFLHPILDNVLILCLLKSSEIQRFSGVFRGFKMGNLSKNGLIHGNLTVNMGLCLVFIFLYSEEYLQPCRTSRMKLFYKNS